MSNAVDFRVHKQTHWQFKKTRLLNTRFSLTCTRNRFCFQEQHPLLEGVYAVKGALPRELLRRETMESLREYLSQEIDEESGGGGSQFISTVDNLTASEAMNMPDHGNVDDECE